MSRLKATDKSALEVLKNDWHEKYDFEMIVPTRFGDDYVCLQHITTIDGEHKTNLVSIESQNPLGDYHITDIFLDQKQLYLLKRAIERSITWMELGKGET